MLLRVCIELSQIFLLKAFSVVINRETYVLQIVLSWLHPVSHNATQLAT